MRSPRSSSPILRRPPYSFHTTLLLRFRLFFPRAGLAAYLPALCRYPASPSASSLPPSATPLCQAVCDPGEAQPVPPSRPAFSATLFGLRLIAASSHPDLPTARAPASPRDDDKDDARLRPLCIPDRRSSPTCIQATSTRPCRRRRISSAPSRPRPSCSTKTPNTICRQTLLWPCSRSTTVRPPFHHPARQQTRGIAHDQSTLTNDRAQSSTFSSLRPWTGCRISILDVSCCPPANTCLACYGELGYREVVLYLN